MTKYRFLLIPICLFFIFLTACAGNPNVDNMSEYNESKNDTHDIEINDNETQYNYEAKIQDEEKHNNDYRINFVDERFELVSLVLRLAGSEIYDDEYTDYQQSLNETFVDFKNHQAVTYAAKNLKYLAAISLAFDLEKEGDHFIISESHESYLSLRSFVKLLSDFYNDANFAEFFQDNLDYYHEQSERFAEYVYSDINFEWIKQHGIDPDKLQVFLSPASTWNPPAIEGFANWKFGENPDETMAYAEVFMAEDYSKSGIFFTVIHEFCHAIGNPIADIWYVENPDFKKWSDDSVNSILSTYPDGLSMACEYLTRAYAILYMVENTDDTLLTTLFLREIYNGFPYIQEVYAMITDHEIIEFKGNIGSPLGLMADDFVLGEERSLYLEDIDLLVKWQVLDLLGNEHILDGFSGRFVPSSYSKDFASQTGDVLYVTHGERANLLIDLGPDPELSDEHRKYAWLFLDFDFEHIEDIFILYEYYWSIL